ncbi:hypothetical protein TYRP_021158 [Tyrophagus putrescentiae]|nr:hypothetical protein TYRP_021158 [Tyrophagus putrescentiae]
MRDKLEQMMVVVVSLSGEDSSSAVVLSSANAHPAHLLPQIVDLREDALYLGHLHQRVQGADGHPVLGDLVEDYLQAVPLFLGFLHTPVILFQQVPVQQVLSSLWLYAKVKRARRSSVKYGLRMAIWSACESNLKGVSILQKRMMCMM